jgi:ABC-type antimicrobial peptide transport system permease subunit
VSSANSGLDAPRTRVTKRRFLFVIVVLFALALILYGIKRGDPETIHRFSAQI